jgi:beta-phosphoglucomutase
MIRGVIFDLDGVLVATDESHYRAWKQLADEEGIPFDRAINERLRGVSRMESLAIILERAPRSYMPQERAALAERKNAAFRAMLRDLTPADALPGVRELVADLRRRGLKLAVASSSRNAPLILERLEMTGAFDAVVDGSAITRTKPDPEIFLKAAARLGLPPGECLVVEDAAAGIEAARRAGMPVFGIGRPDQLTGATCLAPSLAGITADDLLGAAKPSVSRA